MKKCIPAVTVSTEAEDCIEVLLAVAIKKNKQAACINTMLRYATTNLRRLISSIGNCALSFCIFMA